ncbi:MAG: ATP synthase F0 subunit B [Gemmataceae bacterium]
MRRACAILLVGVLSASAWATEAEPVKADASKAAKDDHAKDAHGKESHGTDAHGRHERVDKLEVTTTGHKTLVLDLKKAEDKQKLDDLLAAGEVAEMRESKPVNVMDLKWDLGLWAIVIFLALFFLLRSKAWGPILQGLQKRETNIRAAAEEAKVARAETAKMQAEYKAEMDRKFAEIPKIMEEARREAEALKEDLRSQANKEIQAERQRMRREIDSARDQALKDIWDQAAQLATQISAKVIGKTLTPQDHHRLIDESLLEMRSMVRPN